MLLVFRFLYNSDPSIYTAPEGKGVYKMNMYYEKFGKERVDAMIPQMVQTGKALEPPVNFSYGGFTGNTFNSHRIIYAAKEIGGAPLQDKVIEQFFKAQKMMNNKNLRILFIFW